MPARAELLLSPPPARSQIASSLLQTRGPSSAVLMIFTCVGRVGRIKTANGSLELLLTLFLIEDVHHAFNYLSLFARISVSQKYRSLLSVGDLHHLVDAFFVVPDSHRYFRCSWQDTLSRERKYGDGGRRFHQKGSRN